MGRVKGSGRTARKAKAFIRLLYARGDENVMAKLYDIFYWEELSDTQALCRTELWQELERSLGKNSGGPRRP